jgi:alpha-N-arabinofuranosidase
MGNQATPNVQTFPQRIEMKTHCIHLLAVTFCVAAFVSTAIGQTTRETSPTVVVHDEPLHDIDVRLFGQFLERPSGSERGIEAAVVPGTHRLQDGVVELLKAMEIPVVRFPAGTDVDHIDWRDMIDRVPGRDGPRPKTTGKGGDEVSNNFGYDEYFALRDKLDCQTILVLNLLDGLAKRKEPRQAAIDACGLVAYANAKQGAKLPEGMTDWPAVRAKNGHAKPFRAQYIQLGNEWWHSSFLNAVKEGTGLTEAEELAAWYVKVLHTYIGVIREIDPDVELIVDGNMGWGSEGWVLASTVLRDPYIKRNVNYITFHRYGPASMDKIKRDGETVAHEKLRPIDWWRIYSSLPGGFNAEGQNDAIADYFDRAEQFGYKVACTEWNWNGWGRSRIPEDIGFDWQAATGVGAAGFINGLMRGGKFIRMANQSMLVGEAWRLAAVQVDQEGKVKPHYNTMAPVTTLYRKHHGPKLLKAELRDVPTYSQPYAVSVYGAVNKIALLDVLVTASEKAIFVHAINRDLDREQPLTIDMSKLGPMGKTATVHRIAYPLKANPRLHPNQNVGEESHDQIEWAPPKATINLPPRSVTIIELPRAASKSAQ